MPSINWYAMMSNEEDRLLALSLEDWTAVRVDLMKTRPAFATRIDHLRRDLWYARKDRRTPSPDVPQMRYYRDVADEPWKYGDDAFEQWVLLDNDLPKYPGRWRVDAYWTLRQEESRRRRSSRRRWTPPRRSRLSSGVTSSGLGPAGWTAPSAWGTAWRPTRWRDATSAGRATTPSGGRSAPTAGCRFTETGWRTSPAAAAWSACRRSWRSRTCPSPSATGAVSGWTPRTTMSIARASGAPVRVPMRDCITEKRIEWTDRFSY